MISPSDFSFVTHKMRDFFNEKGFLEVHTQNRLSILAACEDPTTVKTYDYSNEIWPLPQTGQMWLEYELLNDPDAPGFYCLSTSYRQEQNPLPGRHEQIFPMFEFESKGGFQDLIELESELCTYLGFDAGHKRAPIDGIDFPGGHYTGMMAKYTADELTAKHEEDMYKEYGDVFFLTHFPYSTSPFWNMKRSETPASNGPQVALKCDVITGGMETIGSAERATDIDDMREQFYTISDGGYAKLLYDMFGEERVKKELDEFLQFDFIPRFGGGIGVTRMISAMKRAQLMPVN